MNANGHDIGSYSWSILVDVHARLGDFEGCAGVIKEMASEGVAPSAPAYTSLLAACFKICNDGRVAHSIRAKAGEVGWRHWQEMRIVGIEPDAMSYGAVLRLCQARGQPERAINLLEEMQRFEVKPTTLCFTSALRAIARSHETAIRFERGWSRKQLRRESFASHHGLMARKVVIMAENAQVEIDDGFTSALMLCAAAAGDSATAKAVYLASEVRKLDHLRPIGSDSHLKQLRSEETTSEEQTGFMQILNGDKLMEGDTQPISSITPNNGNDASLITQGNRLPSFTEREYGKDTRPIAALLKSCAQALCKNGIGTMWGGSQNQGYLCENSLRLLTTRWEPEYTDKSIPGVDSTKLGISSLRKFPEDERERNEKPGTRKKFRGLVTDDEVAMNVEDLDEDFFQIATSGNGMENEFDIEVGSSTETDTETPGKIPREIEHTTGTELKQDHLNMDEEVSHSVILAIALFILSRHTFCTLPAREYTCLLPCTTILFGWIDVWQEELVRIILRRLLDLKFQLVNSNPLSHAFI